MQPAGLARVCGHDYWRAAVSARCSRADGRILRCDLNQHRFPHPESRGSMFLAGSNSSGQLSNGYRKPSTGGVPLGGMPVGLGENMADLGVALTCAPHRNDDRHTENLPECAARFKSKSATVSRADLDLIADEVRQVEAKAQPERKKQMEQILNEITNKRNSPDLQRSPLKPGQALIARAGC